MQCSRQGGDAAAVARRRELAFVTSSARGLPSCPGRNSGAQSQGGHRVALRVPGLRPAGSWSRGHATCREDPEPRREDGCRQACRLSGLSVTDEPAVSHPELYFNQIVKGGVSKDRWGVNQSQRLKGMEGSQDQGAEKHEGTGQSSGITDQEKELSTNAFQAFTAGNYDACLQHLACLQDINKDDYKIILNTAVAEFFKSNQTTTDSLRQTLNQLKNQVHSAVEEMDGLDDVENSMLYYNQAVILYHLRQYTEAISVGEKLYQFIEPFEEKFAQAVCFLLVDLYILTYQAEKALHLLAVLEKMISQGNNNKNGKNETGNNTNKDSSNHKAESGALIEAAKSKIHQYKVRAYIQMKSLKACKREIKSVMNTAGNSAPSLFLKSNFEYLRGNYRKAVKLLNSSNIAEHPGFLKTGECLRCMFWNNLGCIHFAMSKHNLGIFYFKKALQENDNVCAQLSAGSTDPGKKFSGRPMCTLLTNKRYELLYNCGIQLLHIGRPLAAFECLIEAVQVYHANPRLWLRLAECCIAANKGTSEQETKGLPSKKGIVQSIVGQGYHRKIVLASQSIQNTVYNDGQSSAIPVASMEFAAICLRNALLLLPEEQQDLKQENGSKNSNQLGGNTESSESSETCSKSHEGDKFIPAPPSSPLRKQELENLKCSILACSAYVALALGDNLMALNHADKLLQQPKLSGSLKFLGHLYAAEALISLDRISDAITHLNPENVTDVSLGISSNEQDQGSDKGENEAMESSGKRAPQCYPSSVNSARTVMLFNLGSAYCLRSEYDKARKCLHQVRQRGLCRLLVKQPAKAASMIHPKEIPPEAILLAVYLELQNGNTQLALQIIKRNQLLPTVKTLSEMRKKPVFQPVHPIQPIQMPAFTVQRK
ncbi:CCR4-NOT transcription complex subunit 10 isoform X2 [Myotis lucifugus]|uniref:CCR4-NOT transcription complex subunit 10 isoform X2 n=1 Tax=Myotis lucifugus TaxID=59463 RepID=UPI000CCC9877|nr:CCR4-NOT transcription complex subunit 10 isoform X2 [Myotis lucifugus]